MNTHVWTQYFLANRHRFIEPPLPGRGSTMPESIRGPMAHSLAIFQLGESGGGARLIRYVRRVVSEDRLRGYEEAVQLFIEEEQYHSRLLDQRDCFRAVGLDPHEFARMASRTGARFLRRLEKPHTLWLARQPAKEAATLTNA